MPKPSAPSPWGRRTPVAEAGDARRHAPSASRNEAPILDVLRDVLPATGRALEIGSGTGQHIAAFARTFPGLQWQPSDPFAESRASTAAWVAETGLDNLADPIAVDVTTPDWPAALDGPRDAIVCINVLHIAPWAVTEGLMAGAGRPARARRHPLPLRPLQARRPPHRPKQRRLRRIPAPSRPHLGHPRHRRRRDLRQGQRPHPGAHHRHAPRQLLARLPAWLALKA